MKGYMAEGVKTQYRLVCHYRGETSTCVFDDSPGKKGCDPDVQLEIVGNRKNRIKGEGEKLAQIQFKGDKRREVGFQTYWKSRLSQEYKGRSYHCEVARLNAEDEEKMGSFPETHPRTWKYVAPYLDDQFGYSGMTFREKALMYLRYGFRDEEMIPHILTEAANKMCLRYENIPEIPTREGRFYPAPFIFPTELKECADDSSSGEMNLLLGKRSGNVENDRNCLWNSLVRFVPQTHYRPPEKGPVHILDMASGDAMGAQALVSYFEEFRNAGFPETPAVVQYSGVDPDKDAIADARKLNPALRFIEETSTGFFGPFPHKKFDVILLRHPGPIKTDWGDASGMWAKIMREVYDHLADDGVLIVTTYFCYEYHFAEAFFRNELGAHIFLAGLNPFRHKRLLIRDSYLMMVGKGPKRPD